MTFTPSQPAARPARRRPTCRWSTTPETRHGITHSTGVSSGVVTPGLGFQHNCHMLMFDPQPGQRNSIAPWKRPITGGGPALFLRDGQAEVLIGSPPALARSRH